MRLLVVDWVSLQISACQDFAQHECAGDVNGVNHAGCEVGPGPRGGLRDLLLPGLVELSLKKASSKRKERGVSALDYWLE